MAKVYEFDAVIIKQKDINSAYIEFPFDVQKEFGIRGQVKVVASFDGLEYRGSLVTMGHYCHIIGLTQKVRSAIGKNPGDSVHVIMTQDTELRMIETPEDFQTLLDLSPVARTLFDNLSFTHKKAYVEWITSAKKSETRERRLGESIEKLINNFKHP